MLFFFYNLSCILFFFFFFFNDTATTEIYTLSLHDALPISLLRDEPSGATATARFLWCDSVSSFHMFLDRKSTRLNSSHSQISYAVFCLKKKKKKKISTSIILMISFQYVINIIDDTLVFYND